MDETTTKYIEQAIRERLKPMNYGEAAIATVIKAEKRRISKDTLALALKLSVAENEAQYAGLSDQVNKLAARLKEAEASVLWIPVSERRPETPPENSGYSLDYYLLAYKVEGCDYHGLMTVSRYHVKDGWSYRGEFGGLTKWGYEAVAWRELPESYQDTAQP
jgi:uncharacterized small protein (DUF1192 family)